MTAFRKVIEDGLILSDKGRLVTFGIVPYSPETGFGYIKSFQELSKLNPSSKIERFVEKPNLKLAEKFKIPISESLDSYNVSVAAALVLYEFFRQNN